MNPNDPIHPDNGYSGPGAGGPGLIGALVQTAGGLYDSYQNRKAAAKNTEMTISAQKAQAELAYQRQIEMWNLQNQYNSPSEQMKRFGAAGLNPHLIYGQGNAGNANSMPQYNPPNIQYKYAAGNYGQAVASALPMLMQVGSWLQNMRLTEAEIDSKRTGIDKTQQAIDFLVQQNPQLVRKQSLMNEGLLSQNSYLDSRAMKAWTDVASANAEFKFRYGHSADSWSAFEKGIGGLRGQQLLQSIYKSRIEGAKARWADYGVTDPQALMQLVLGGAMRMLPSLFKGSRNAGFTRVPGSSKYYMKR